LAKVIRIRGGAARRSRAGKMRKRKGLARRMAATKPEKRRTMVKNGDNGKYHSGEDSSKARMTPGAWL